MPEAKPIGKVGDDAHDRLVKELEEYWDYYSDALSPRFREMVGDKKLWLGHRDDNRKPHEKWRSLSWLGDPYKMTRIAVDAWLEIMGSSDPPIQCEGVDTPDVGLARGFEAWGDYMLRGNRWTASQEMLFRNLDIMGWQPIKTGWREIKYGMTRRPSSEERAQFDLQINEALKTGIVSSPPMSEDPKQWQSWYQDNKQIYPNTPKPLSLSDAETVSYRGPWYFYPSPFQLRFDPYVEDLTQQTIFFERFVKPRSWTKRQVAEGKFDAAQVEEAGRGTDTKRLSEWDAEIASEIGLSYSENDPAYKNADEFWEIWRPHSDHPYLVIMNRKAIVNVSTKSPFWHKQLPYHFIKNIPISGYPFGMSSYAQMRRTFQDRCTFRDLLLDGLLLSVMPVFLKSRNLGIADMQRFLKPGAILDVNDPNGLRPGWTSMAGFAELMQVGNLLLGDQQTLTSTGENVAGQPATVGRVSATETQSRLQQALVPHKKKAERLEEEETNTLPQMYYNVYQFMPSDDPGLQKVRASIAGDETKDPFLDKRFDRESFAEVLRINVRFRGATNKLNKELFVQQLKDWLATASTIQSAAGVPVPIMSPNEARGIMRQIAETFAIKGSANIMTKEGDEAVANAVQAYLINASAAPIAAQTQLVQAQEQLRSVQATSQGTAAIQPLQDQSMQLQAQTQVMQGQVALSQAQKALQAEQQPPPQPEAPPPPPIDPQLRFTPPDIQQQIFQRSGYQPSQMLQQEPAPEMPPQEQVPPEDAPPEGSPQEQPGEPQEAVEEAPPEEMAEPEGEQA